MNLKGKTPTTSAGSARLPTGAELVVWLLRAQTDGFGTAPAPALLELWRTLRSGPSAAQVETVQREPPRAGRAVAMLSGGGGSTAAFWRALTATHGVTLTAVFVESQGSVVGSAGSHRASFENRRRECVRRLMLESRTSEGRPLADGPPWQPRLRSVRAPPEWDHLEPRMRLAASVAFAADEVISSDGPITLVWGSSAWEHRDVLAAMEGWCFAHWVPFPGPREALFALAECELWSNRGRSCDDASSSTDAERPIAPEATIVSAGACLPLNCTDLVCSCRGVVPVDRNPDLPLAAMCGACAGCAPWFASWNSLCLVVPTLRIGGRHNGRGDGAHWSTLPTLRVETKAPPAVAAAAVGEPSQRCKEALSAGKPARSSKSRAPDGPAATEADNAPSPSPSVAPSQKLKPTDKAVAPRKAKKAVDAARRSNSKKRPADSDSGDEDAADDGDASSGSDPESGEEEDDDDDEDDESDQDDTGSESGSGSEGSSDSEESADESNEESASDEPEEDTENADTEGSGTDAEEDEDAESDEEEMTDDGDEDASPLLDIADEEADDDEDDEERPSRGRKRPQARGPAAIRGVGKAAAARTQHGRGDDDDGDEDSGPRPTPKRTRR